MLAVHFAQGLATVQQISKPRPKRGQALLKLRLAGICNTDIELLHGYYGFAGIPGHEFVADVVQAEDANWVGKRVVGEINLGCGKCERCGQGMGRHCARRTVLGIVKHPGAFAEYLTLPVENLLEVPRALEDRQAVFTEPLAAACEILEQVRFPKGARVAVLGDGKLGLLIAQVLHFHGLRVALYGRNPGKMGLLRPLGLKSYVVGQGEAERYPYVVDATGSAKGFHAAAGMVEPRGTVVLKSTVHEKLEMDMAPVIVNEVTLIGSRCGRFAPALKLMKKKELVLEGLIHGEFELGDAVEALEFAQRAGILKILLKPTQKQYS